MRGDASCVVREHLGEPPLRRLDERRVERAGDRQAPRADVALGAPRDRGLDRGSRARDDGLPRRVQVRDHDVDLRQQPLERLGRRLDRRHRAGLLARLLPDEAPARLGQQQQVVLADAPGRGQRDELAVAVARDELRLDAERPQHAEAAEVDRAERGLRDVACR